MCKIMKLRKYEWVYKEQNACYFYEDDDIIRPLFFSIYSYRNFNKEFNRLNKTLLLFIMPIILIIPLLSVLLIDLLLFPFKVLWSVSLE